MKRNISSKIIPVTQRNKNLECGKEGDVITESRVGGEGGGGGLDPNKLCASYSKLPELTKGLTYL